MSALVIFGAGAAVLVAAGMYYEWHKQQMRARAATVAEAESREDERLEVMKVNEELDNLEKVEQAIKHYEGQWAVKKSSENTYHLAYSLWVRTQKLEKDQPAEARRDLERIVRLYRDYVRPHNPTDVWFLLGYTHFRLGCMKFKAGEKEGAASDFKKTAELFTELVNKHGRGDLRSELTYTYICLGKLQDAETAAGSFEKAIYVFMAASEAIQNEMLQEVAMMHLHRGRVYRSRDQLGLALAECRRSVELSEKWVAVHVEPEFKGELAEIYYVQGLVLRDMRERQSALEMYGKAVDLYAALLRHGHDGFIASAVSAFNARGLVRQELNDAEGALSDSEMSKKWLDRLKELMKDGEEPASLRAENHYIRGAALYDQGKPADAVSELDIAVRMFNVLAVNPEHEFRAALAMAYGMRGLSYDNLREREAAIEDYGNAVLFWGLYAKGKGLGAVMIQADLFMSRAKVYQEMGEFGKAKEDVAAAEAIVKVCEAREGKYAGSGG
jgi:tetratricopeptide (TPR) repeat protein